MHVSARTWQRSLSTYKAAVEPISVMLPPLLLLLLLLAAAQYVEGFLARPLKEAGFQNVNFTEVR